jgi:hypothetical protein
MNPLVIVAVWLVFVVIGYAIYISSDQEGDLKKEIKFPEITTRR